MRERAVATIGIWFSVALSIYLLLQRLTYSYVITTPDADGRTIATPITEVAPTLWQIGIFVLIFFLIGAAFGVTFIIWEKAQASPQEAPREVSASAKLKRDQKERVRRLLENMDQDDLDALESRISDDGEIVSVDDLLDLREVQRRR